MILGLKCFTSSLKNLKLYPREVLKTEGEAINSRKVPREVLKTEGEAINSRKVPREVLKTEGFQHSRGTLRLLMNDKILFDRYYCINSTKHCENNCALYFITSPHFPTRVRYMQYSGGVQVLII